MDEPVPTPPAPERITVKVTNLTQLACLLLTTPINPKDTQDKWVRLTNPEVLAKIMKYFPHANTSPACVAWYVSKLRKDVVYRAKHGNKFPLNPRKV